MVTISANISVHIRICLNRMRSENFVKEDLLNSNAFVCVLKIMEIICFELF